MYGWFNPKELLREWCMYFGGLYMLFNEMNVDGFKSSFICIYTLSNLLLDVLY